MVICSCGYLLVLSSVTKSLFVEYSCWGHVRLFTYISVRFAQRSIFYALSGYSRHARNVPVTRTLAVNNSRRSVLDSKGVGQTFQSFPILFYLFIVYPELYEPKLL